MKKSILILLLPILLTACVFTETAPSSQASSPVFMNTKSSDESTPTKGVFIRTIAPTPTFTPEPTPVPYTLQTGVPAYLPNFGYPDAGCNWMGVAGQVFASDGTPLANQVILVRGEIDGVPIEVVSLTGTSEGDKYGTAGFEAVLADNPRTTTDVFTIQVFDLDGNILSDRYYFDTFYDCERNLIIINFSE